MYLDNNTHVCDGYLLTFALGCGGAQSEFECVSCKLRVCHRCAPKSKCHLCISNVCPYLHQQVNQHQNYYPQPNHASFLRTNTGGYLAVNEHGVPMETYHMAIIDWLQPFNLRKRAESKLKVTSPSPLKWCVHVVPGTGAWIGYSCVCSATGTLCQSLLPVCHLPL
jgi:hypothetical protein